MSSLGARTRAFLGRIRIRLLAVNLTVVLIPAAGLEFARIYERQLLDGLERDMANQAVLVRTLVEAGLARGEPIAPETWEAVLRRAAQQTRTRIRIVTLRMESRSTPTAADRRRARSRGPRCSAEAR